MRNRLYRSRDDRVIGGVAGGLAEWFDLDPSLVRIGWVILGIFSGGAFVLIYLVMLIVVPEEPDVYDWDRGATPGTPPPAGGPADAPMAGTEATDSTVVGGTAAAGAPFSSTSAPTSVSTQPSWSDMRAQQRADRAARRAARRRAGPGSGGLVFGLILILVGAYFLLRQFVPQFDLDLLWPLAVIALGAVLLVAALRPGGRSEG
jgi:phage shock protein C